jgi:regulator of sigma E protease
MTISALIIFFAILFFLVVVHEFGHFLFAKLTGMRVDEFAFGFPPTLYTKKIGETSYSFNSVPLGGYVKIYGENGVEEGEGVNSQKSFDYHRSFAAKSTFARIVVLLAGVVFNVIAAAILFSATFMLGSDVGLSPDEALVVPGEKRDTVIMGLDKNSPLSKLGVEVGSKALSLSTQNELGKYSIDKSKWNTKIISDFIQRYPNQSFAVTYLDLKNATKTIDVVPVAGIVDGKKVLGVQFADVTFEKFTFIDAFVNGAKFTYYQIIFIFTEIFKLFGNLFTGDARVSESLSGPVGLAMITGKIAEQGLDKILYFAGMLSLSLAVFNILPLPALDGGRIVFVLIEMITRRKVPKNIEQTVHAVGFLLLIGLMLFVTYYDLLKVFK